MKALFIFFFSFAFAQLSIAQSKDYAVEVGAFAEKVSLSYFKISGVYETYDQNQIYRYYIDAPSKADAETLRQKAITAGHPHARVIDFNYIKEQCDAQCGYTPPARTSKQTSTQQTGTNPGNNLTTASNTIDNSNPASGSNLTEEELRALWEKEMLKMGYKLDSAGIHDFWNKEKNRIKIDSATWFKLFGKELNAKKSSLRISDIDMYIYWSNELKRQGYKIDSADLFTFWRKERDRIGLDKAAWFELFRKDLEKLKSKYFGDNPNNISFDSPDDARRVRCLFFDFGSSALRSESKKELDKLLVILTERPDWVVEIGAHADSKGSVDANRKISMRRASSAKKYLISKGLAVKRIDTHYYGKSQPIARNEMPDGSDTEQGRQLNRRVEFSVFNSTGEKMDIILKIEVPQHLQY